MLVVLRINNVVLVTLTEVIKTNQEIKKELEFMLSVMQRSTPPEYL